MGWLDFVILGAVVLAVGLALWYSFRGRRRGKNSCGGACAGCPSAGSCASAQAGQPPKP